MERIHEPKMSTYCIFSRINRFEFGSGLVYIYSGVMKNTREGKPFVTLYLRDVEGNTLPSYIFDLSNPLVSGGEVSKVVGKIAKISYRENFINGRGLSLILNSVEVAVNPSVEDVAKFSGKVTGVEAMYDELVASLYRDLGVKISYSMASRNASTQFYGGGKVGGLVEHYSRLYAKLASYKGVMTASEYRQLIGSFAVFIYAHSAYLCNQVSIEGKDTLPMLSVMLDKAKLLGDQLNLGSSTVEIVNMFYGYEPKDFYIRIINRESEAIRVGDAELHLYRTLPINNDGSAGHGIVRRYKVEEDV